MMASRYDDLNYVLNLAIVQDPPPGSYGTPEPRPQQVGLTHGKCITTLFQLIVPFGTCGPHM